MKPPFLKSISVNPDIELGEGFPYNLPFISSDFSIQLSCPVTIIVGENGSGKSTFLESIAANCGFNILGGNANNIYRDQKEEESLSKCLRFSWVPRIRTGFFMRAESFFTFINHIEKLVEEGEDHEERMIRKPYGGKSLHNMSHGEAFFSLFENRFGQKGIYILDEPESALSPRNQLRFLRKVREMENEGNVQIIIATHSPILMSYPGACVLSLSDNGFEEKNTQTQRILKYMKNLFLILIPPQKRQFMMRILNYQFEPNTLLL